MKDWRYLSGKRVTVYAAGVAYRGTVVELGERTLLLRAEAGFREIPWERITKIEEDRTGGTAGGSRGPLPPGWA